MEKIYDIKGMSCSSCASSVERILNKIDGIEQASVNLVLERVTIRMSKEVPFTILKEKIEKGGYTLLERNEKETKTYALEGMFCASCSASVERILQRFNEIEKANVNLIMNNVTITSQEQHFDEWRKALEKAGYTLSDNQSIKKISFPIIENDQMLNDIFKGIDGIHECQIEHGDLTISYDKNKIRISEIHKILDKHHIEIRKEQEEARTKRFSKEQLYIYSTLIIGAVLLYIGMSHMLGEIELPLPDIIHYVENPFNFAFIQFILATIILLFGHAFFTRGIKALIHLTPNMDTLVAIGTGSAYLYSLYSMIRIYQGDLHAVHALYFESAGVVVALVQFGKYLEHISKVKSTGAITALLQLRPKTATLLRDGKEIEILSDEIEIGDLIVVKPGDHIAVDGIIREGSAHVDESMLTGESMPVNKAINDRVIQGTINLDGKLVLECNVSQDETTLANIIRMVEEAQGKKAPIARIADRISLFFVPAVMLIAIIASVLWYASTNDFSFALTIFVSVLVIACPCALGLATPTAIMVGTGKAAQMGIFIKSGEALETASGIDTVLFDKTGTITVGKPVVTNIKSLQKEHDVLQIAALLEQGSRHPLATAILLKASEQNIVLEDLHEINTDNGKGLRSNYKGERIAAGSDSYMIELKLDVTQYKDIAVTYQQEGKTVVWVAYGQQVIGCIAIADALKDHVAEVIQKLYEQRIDVYMVSGDNEVTAKAIASQAGIHNVIAQVLPDQKGEVVRRLQVEGKKVAMVGDGINDALALTQSDVGIAIGSGSDVALESADIVLMKDNIYDVLQTIRLSKAVIRNIRQNLFWAFFYNTLGIPIAAGLFYAFGGVLLSPVFAGAAMAFSSVSVVANALRLRNFK